MQCFAWKGHYYFVIVLLAQSDILFTQDETPKNFDTALKLIFRMGQGACRFCFYP